MAAAARPKTASTAAEALQRYRDKRDFSRTAEPRGDSAAPGASRQFVIQKHDARRLHYDLRLELDGVLVSWAVPKGPSFDRANKRMAIHVEDHPLEYASFEGTIAPKQCAAGEVIVCNKGTCNAATSGACATPTTGCRFRRSTRGRTISRPGRR